MCLNYEQGRLVSNRLSFAEPNQKFEKRLASCNSSFIPYNVVGPSQLASKTIEHFCFFLMRNIKMEMFFPQILVYLCSLISKDSDTVIGIIFVKLILRI